MADNLASAGLKLDHARHHLKALKHEVGVFMSRKPYGLSDTVEGQGVYARWQEVSLEEREEPPIELGPIAGDAIGNLNAALDHLVYGLSVSKPRGTGFPTTIDPDAYVRTTVKKKRSDRERLLAGVPDPERAIIDAYQPYENQMEADPLWRMREWVNEDKHRISHPAWARVRTVRIIAPGCEVRVARNKVIGPFRDGTLLFRFQVRCGGESPTVKVKTEADMSIGFGPMLVDLVEFDDMADRVEEIIACF